MTEPTILCARCLLANETPEPVVTIANGNASCLRHWEQYVALLFSETRDAHAEG